MVASPLKRLVSLALISALFLVAAGPLAAQDSPAKAKPSANPRVLQPELKKIFEKDSLPDYWKTLEGIDTSLKGRKAFQRGLRVMDEEEDTRSYLPHAANYLTKMPPADDFSHVLWRLLSHVEWAERSVGDDGIFPALAKVAARLPHDDEHYFESRFTTATYHQHRGETELASAILDELGNDDHLPAAFSPTLLHRRGLALEAEGKIAEAVELHSENADLESPSGISSAVRTVFLHLGEGHRGKAREILTSLSDLEEDSLLSAPGGFQIARMLELEALGELAPMWAYQKEWRTKFEKIFALISPSHPDFDGNQPAPVIAQEADFLALLDALADAPDADGYAEALWLAAEAARWDIRSLNNLSRSLLFNASAVVPTKATDIRTFVAELSSCRFGETSERHSSALFQTLALLQLGKDKQAAEIAERDTNSGRPVPKDVAGQALLRLWATAVRRIDGEVEGPGRALEELLDSKVAVHDRLSTVDSLVRIYQQIGEPGEEENLLKRELNKPSYKEDPNALQGLLDRYKTSTEAGRESRALAQASALWIREEAPAWLEFARPTTIEDLSAKEIAELVESPFPTYSFLEGAKLRLLAARDSGLPAETRSAAFQSAIETIINVRNDFSLLQETYARLAQNPRFPEPQRRYFAWLALANAAYSDHKPTIRELLNSSLFEESNGRLDDAMEAIKALLNCNRMDPESILKTVDQLAEAPVGNFDLLAIDTLTQRLLALGDLEGAQSVLKGIRGWEMSPDIAQGRVKMGIEILGMISGFEGRAERNEQLGDIALELFPEAGMERPEFFHRLSPGDVPPNWLSDSEARDFLVHQIRQGLHHNWQFDAWLALCDQIPHPTPAADLDHKFAIIEALLESLSKDDGARAGVVGDLASLFDIDSPEERNRVLALIRPLAKDKSKKSAATRFSVGLYEISAKLRDGEVLDIPAEFESLKHPSKRFFEVHNQLEQAIKLDRKDDLREILAGLAENELADPSLLTLIHHARTVLGEEPGSTLEENLRKNRDSYLVHAAATGEPSAVYRVISATKALGDVRHLPEGWYEQFTTHCRRHRQLVMTGAYLAELEEDWPKLEQLGAEGIEHFPTYYDFYRFHGMALAERGENAGAIKALETYCKYSRNELQYPEAQALLDRLKAAGYSEKTEE